MEKIILNFSEKIFNKLKSGWTNPKANKISSIFLVSIFIVSIIISYLDRSNLISLGKWDEYFANPFFAIEISFTLLLILELLSLIFVLPKSVSNSVGKQLELLSLIFIRAAFKEFSHISDFSWDSMSTSVINMLFYAFGALIIFVILGFTYKLQLHTPITNIEDDNRNFIQSKKLLALFLLISFFIIGIYDLKELFNSGNYLHSFHTFYTILIFSDIIIVLIALRYTLNYYKIFRYSAYVVATIFIRISLSIKPYYDVIIGIIAAIFVLFLTLSYNYFLRDIPKKKLEQ
ncbi:hypothetical protein [Lutibacter flavus]|uniref:Uncharacterized protein n=1 Tax=Lutibacter flavus TaxID=691689 RepID=A0A238ZMS9_9FLAO|nr:hypothetical protein [Lutibacter flavus]SNR84439.1 hypothetical protein SAMN04488111_3431 [Lutibacter flavus]